MDHEKTIEFLLDQQAKRFAGIEEFRAGMSEFRAQQAQFNVSLGSAIALVDWRPLWATHRRYLRVVLFGLLH